LQHHFGAARLRWTVFNLRFCGFASQKYSTKPQIKACR
jgi:hypothetical protein